jgi:YVTN family beta-propeller protein
VTIGDAPCGVVGGGGKVWVSVFNDGTLYSVDPETMAVSDPVPVGTNPCGLAVGGGSVWVENYGSDDVTRVNLATGAVQATIPVGSEPYDVTYAAGAAWVTNYADGTVTRIDGKTQKRQVIVVSDNPIGIVAAGGTVWVAHLHGDLVGIDPRTRAVTTRSSVGAQANWTAARGNDLWIGGRQTNQVVRVDARTGKVRARYDIGELPLDGDVVAGVAWFPDKAGQLHELPRDPSISGRVLDSGVGWPFVIAGVDGLIWAADYTGTDLVRLDPSLS